MRTQIVTILLIVGIGFTVIRLISQAQSYRFPGNQQGYAPEQPVAFSHRLHAGELQISCMYCHSGAEKSRYAGIPATSTCMNCHKNVTAPLGIVRAEEARAKEEGRKPNPVVSPEINKLYEALGLDAELKSNPTKTAKPIPWIKVHNLPDYVYFDHRPHVKAGVSCQHCHGPVESMERVHQAKSLSMGWCVNCHREVNHVGVQGKPVHASNDCAVCHY